MPLHVKKLAALVLGFAVALAAATPISAATAKKKYKHAKRTAVGASKAQYRGTDKFRPGPLYYNGGEYLGDDPDPNIRFQLWRDVSGRFGGDGN